MPGLHGNDVLQAAVVVSGEEGDGLFGTFREGRHFGVHGGDGLAILADFHLQLLFFQLQSRKIPFKTLEGVPLDFQFVFGEFDFRHGF